MKFAIEVDGTKQENIPTEPKANNQSNYYKVTADCDDGIKAEWDYNAWNLKVENINKGTKCKLAFNSTLSETDYKNYIEAGVAYRRNTYRGKDLTSYFKEHTEEFYASIKNGTFDDIFVGDYIESDNLTYGQLNMNSYASNMRWTGQKVRWIVADMDNYMHSGSPIISKHHLTIIPALPLEYAPMNDENTTSGAYSGSKMVGYQVGEDARAITDGAHQGILDNIYESYIMPSFGEKHILEYTDRLMIYFDADKNQFNTNMVKRKYDLMSDVNVNGVHATTAGMTNKSRPSSQQLSIFKLMPAFINSYGDYVFPSWLQSVYDKTSFFLVHSAGDTAAASAGDLSGVRPYFLVYGGN